VNLHPKVAAGGLGGALALILVWALGYAVTIPPEVAAAFTLLLSSLCAWLAPWFAAMHPDPK
jgi:hypothetical protein